MSDKFSSGGEKKPQRDDSVGGSKEGQNATRESTSERFSSGTADIGITGSGGSQGGSSSEGGGGQTDIRGGAAGRESGGTEHENRPTVTGDAGRPQAGPDQAGAGADSSPATPVDLAAPQSASPRNDSAPEHEARGATRTTSEQNGNQKRPDATNRRKVDGTGNQSRDSKEALSEREREERNTKAEYDRGAAFEYDKAVVTPDQKEKLALLVPDINKSLQDSKKYVSIEGKASRPGSDGHNQALSERRAEATKKALVELGVPEDRIRTSGEGEVRHLPEEADAELRDNAYDRVATVEIQSEPSVSEELPDPLDERWKDIDKDEEAGKQIFEEITTPITDVIKSEHQMPENPVMDAPSEDLGEFGDQVKDVAKDAKEALNPKNTVKVAAKYLAGSLIDLANSNFSGDVNAARQSYYAMVAEGLASGLDPDYKPRTAPQNREQREILAGVKKQVQGLSDVQKHQLKVHLVGQAQRQSLGASALPRHDYYQNRMNGSGYRLGAGRIFNDSNYRYR